MKEKQKHRRRDMNEMRIKGWNEGMKGMAGQSGWGGERQTGRQENRLNRDQYRLYYTVLLWLYLFT